MIMCIYIYIHSIYPPIPSGVKRRVRWSAWMLDSGYKARELTNGEGKTSPTTSRKLSGAWPCHINEDRKQGANFGDFSG